MYTLEPLLTYSPTISARRCQAMMLCHSARSCHSPALSLNRSLVARLNFATGTPLGVYLTSGSLPRFPTRITLFTLFGIVCLRERLAFSNSGAEVCARCSKSTFRPEHWYRISLMRTKRALFVCSTVVGVSLL